MVEEILKVINEFEDRGVEGMFFNQTEFEIYEDEVEDFAEYGYIVEYIGMEYIQNEGYVDVFHIKRAN